jgi:hypothetical protein
VSFASRVLLVLLDSPCRGSEGTGAHGVGVVFSWGLAAAGFIPAGCCCVLVVVGGWWGCVVVWVCVLRIV